MFRTYQGWTALTRQGKGDGTLQLIPIANSMVYILLRALQDDVPETELCGAEPARALQEVRMARPAARSSYLHPHHGAGRCCLLALRRKTHAVEDQHNGKGYSNVIYIGATVGCPKNQAYLPGQAAAFLAGKTPPDFAPTTLKSTSAVAVQKRI